jgi:hypothetical protein
LSVLVRECNKEPPLLYLLQHARQVLNVVYPSESVRELDLLVGGELCKVLCDMGMGKDVSRCDRVTYEEHAGFQMCIKVLR